MRRKRFEAWLIAMEVGKLFGGTSAGGSEPERVSEAELWAAMGIKMPEGYAS